MKDMIEVLEKEGCEKLVQEAALRVRQGRAAFTPDEDAALMQWVVSNPQLRPTGQRLWQAAEKAGVTRHTWQSMNNRYRRHLMPKHKSLQPGRGDPGSGSYLIKDRHASPECSQQKGCPLDLQLGAQLLKRRKQDVTCAETFGWRHVIPLLHPVVCSRRPMPAFEGHRHVHTKA